MSKHLGRNILGWVVVVAGLALMASSWFYPDAYPWPFAGGLALVIIGAFILRVDFAF
jgi:hypothetical protein